MIPINSATMASSPAPGTPMSTKPTPTSSIWMKAIPTTPWATARMVAVHNTVMLGPRSGPDSRVAMAMALRSPFSP
ncbi:hypothetical protein D3C75_1161510 [compost metagenome]